MQCFLFVGSITLSLISILAAAKKNPSCAKHLTFFIYTVIVIYGYVEISIYYYIAIYYYVINICNIRILLYSGIVLFTGLLAKILKENNILQVQINAEHLRKRYKRVLYRKKRTQMVTTKEFLPISKPFSVL